jgi:hypothetical protein
MSLQSRNGREHGFCSSQVGAEVSDFPPRVEALREMIRMALPEADFRIEEIWKSHGERFTDERISERFWRVSISTGKTADDYDRLPTVIDVPDKLVLDSRAAASLMVRSSANLIVTPKPRKRIDENPRHGYTGIRKKTLR